MAEQTSQHTAAIVNFNIGVMGHVDSGKSSLCKALSKVASTAAFDKHPQSQERGITIDLGFSSFFLDVPALNDSPAPQQQVQVTLIDMPGHASLIRTIIGGSRIMDMMILVIDVTKGIQTQTSECLVIGEITTDSCIIVLNKIDLIPEDQRERKISKMQALLRKALANTKFASSQMIPVAANVSSQDQTLSNLEVHAPTLGLDQLLAALRESIRMPNRESHDPKHLVMAVDHCFALKGRGTIMTGTILEGSVSVGDAIEIPELKEKRKVKSLQSFKRNVVAAHAGDRVGLCVTQFDKRNFERGLICKEGSALATCQAAIASVHGIRFYKSIVQSGQKYHISIGHDTVMTTVTFLRSTSTATFSLQSDLEYAEQLQPDIDYVLFEFERTITVPSGALYIASKLDMAIDTKECRLAFYGNLIHVYSVPNSESYVHDLKVFKWKERFGVIDRLSDNQTLIIRDMFKKETVLSPFEGLKVTLHDGTEGTIIGGFGQSGKVKCYFPSGVNDELLSRLSGKKGNKSSNLNGAGDDELRVSLRFKRYIYDKSKKVTQ